MEADQENKTEMSEPSVCFGSERKPWQQLLSESGTFTDLPTVSPPQQDCCSVYSRVPGINFSDFQLPPTGLTAQQRELALNQLYKYEFIQQARFLGYQANQKLDYESDLQQYLNFNLNNVGDPFQSGNLTVNTKFVERAVLDYYASLWNAKWPHNPQDPDSYWGYVLTMGSTEGNLYGMWNGRDYLAGKFLLDDPAAEEEARQASLNGEPRSVSRNLIYQKAHPPKNNPHAYTPVAFYSEDTHYSLVKAMQALEINTFYEIGTRDYPEQNPLKPGTPWPKEVPSIRGDQGPGSIDVKKLVTLVKFFASKGYPILICFNYGTTFKGAYDDVEAAGKALMPIFKKYGLYERRVHYNPDDPTQYDVRNGFWFHVDGALGAAYMPFIEMAHQAGKISDRGPNFDFRLPFVHSLVMSGHKWIGSPWPCGIYMTKVKYQLRPPDDPEYLGSPDTTFAGSRSGFSPLIFWDYLAKNSYADQIKKALYTNELTHYAHQKLLQLQKELKQDLWVAHTPLSLTIRFKRPNPSIVFKYSLANESMYFKGNEKRDYSHIYLMAQVTTTLIDDFIEDLRQQGAFPEQDTRISHPQTDVNVTKNAQQLIHIPHTGRSFR